MHAEERRKANLEQLHAHNGPYFNHWRQRMAATFSIPTSESQKAS